MGGVIHTLLTFCIVNFAWVFFRMPHLGDAIGVIGRMTTPFSNGLSYSVGNSELLFYTVGLGFLIAMDIHREFFVFRYLNKWWIKFAFYVLLLMLVVTMGILDSSQFIYVSF